MRKSRTTRKSVIQDAKNVGAIQTMGKDWQGMVDDLKSMYTGTHPILGKGKRITKEQLINSIFATIETGYINHAIEKAISYGISAGKTLTIKDE